MRNKIKTLVKLLILGSLILLIIIALKHGVYENVLKRFSLKIFFQSFSMAFALTAFFLLLEKLFPWLKFSFLNFFPKLKSKKDIKKDKKSLWAKVFATLLFILIIPGAYAEEYVFRLGLNSWQGALLSSFLFALTHFILFFRASASISIFVAGLWYCHKYFLGGIYLSAAYHSMNNLLAVIVVGLATYYGKKRKLES